MSVFLVTGRVQDMFYHEPRRCYRRPGSKCRPSRNNSRFAIGDGETANFFSSRFLKTDETSREEQVVYWSWDGGGGMAGTQGIQMGFPRAAGNLQALLDVHAQRD